MTIRHIRIFLTVCHCGNNLTLAARQLYMAQPAVSVAIKEMERYYGTPLFDRIGKRLKLTEAGKRLQEYAMRLTVLFDDMEQVLCHWNSSGIFRIGTSITIGSQFMPAYAEQFCSSHPDADIRIFTGPSSILEDKLVNNELDLALTESPVYREALIAEPYMEDYLTIICPAREPFCPGYVFSLEELQHQKFLLREPGSGAREAADRVLQQCGIFISPMWEGTSTTALVNGVIHGLGISILPRRMVKFPIEKGLVWECQAESLEFRRFFYIVRHRDKILSPPLQDFADMCRSSKNDSFCDYDGLF